MILVANLKHVTEESGAGSLSGRCMLIKDQISNYACHHRVTVGCLKNIYGQNGLLHAFLETIAPHSFPAEA